MRILFSVYYEEFDTGFKQIRFSDIVETELTISQVSEHLQIYDHFHSNLEAGRELAFWDIYCFYDDLYELVEMIKSIPTGTVKASTKKEPKAFEIHKYDPGNTDSAIYPDTDDVFFFTISRYECGASGYNAILAKIVSNPFLIGLTINFTYDICRALFRKLCWKFKRKNRAVKQQAKSEPYYFYVRRFCRNFSKMTSVNRTDFQIVDLKRTKGMQYKVTVRTISNGVYEIKAGYTGKIYGMKMIDKENEH